MQTWFQGLCTCRGSGLCGSNSAAPLSSFSASSSAPPVSSTANSASASAHFAAHINQIRVNAAVMCENVAMRAKSLDSITCWSSCEEGVTLPRKQRKTMHVCHIRLLLVTLLSACNARKRSQSNRVVYE
jgi:hypothetical protein